MKIDSALALRLEAAEGRASCAAATAHALIDQQLGATWTDFDGTLAIFDGPMSPLTQSFALGMARRVGQANLERIESFFIERGASVFHETCPMGDPGLGKLLS